MNILEPAMKRVVLESPFAGEVSKHILYARACVRDCLHRNEAAIASHLLYTQKDILKDQVPEERVLGIRAGFAWNRQAEKVVVYTDFGLSSGMERGIELASQYHIVVEFRKLPAETLVQVIADFQAGYGDFM